MAGSYPSLPSRRGALDAHIRLTAMIAAGEADDARRLLHRHLLDAQAYVLDSGSDTRIVVTRTPQLNPQVVGGGLHARAIPRR